MPTTTHINDIIQSLEAGGVIAYPTESVFGLGCDPFNENAVIRLLQYKHRSIAKGLILIASSWDQVSYLTQLEPGILWDEINPTWPGPNTWVFPASADAPSWITGTHDSIAIRVTDHPLAKKICEQFKGPIVSTSANVDGEPPAVSAFEAEEIFKGEIDYTFDGKVGGLTRPTTIRDALTGKTLRC